MRRSWDIFCTVVDNFGDIGVTWRLARQLAAEYDFQVCLWVDDLHAFNRIWPDANPDLANQTHQGVTVRLWHAEWQPVAAADVVIEAFACHLPESYIDAMAERTRPSLWLNLEYLSAEDWVAGCHGLPSMQPRGLQKFFFFPGFTPQTGGLLREAGLLERRRQFQQDPATRLQFLQRLDVTPAPKARVISLFAYENPGLASWLDQLAQSEQVTYLLVPEGRIIADLQRWLGIHELIAGDRHVIGTLTVQIIGFLQQDDYDRLLWSCDFNAVRGEDSFVRAQWAGKPFLWQIYPQQENTHLLKLQSFLTIYATGLSLSARDALQSHWLAWNKGENMCQSWQALLDVWPEMTEHAENWCQQQAAQTNLAAALVQFYLNWL